MTSSRRWRARNLTGVNFLSGVTFILDTRLHTTCAARAGALCRERRPTPAPLLPLHSTTLRRHTPQHRSCTTPPLLFRFLFRFLFRRRPPPRRRPSHSGTACPLAPSLLVPSRLSPLPSTSTTLLCCAAADPSARQRHGTVWPTASTLLCRQSMAEERSSAPLRHGIPLSLRSFRHRHPLPHSSVARPRRPARDHLPFDRRCPRVRRLSPLRGDRGCPLSTSPWRREKGSAAVGEGEGRRVEGEREERRHSRGGTEVRSAAPPHTPHTRTCTCTTQRRARAALDSDRLHSSSASFVVVLPSSSAPPCQLSLFHAQPLRCILDAFSRRRKRLRSQLVADTSSSTHVPIFAQQIALQRELVHCCSVRERRSRVAARSSIADDTLQKVTFSAVGTDSNCYDL